MFLLRTLTSSPFSKSTSESSNTQLVPTRLIALGAHRGILPRLRMRRVVVMVEEVGESVREITSEERT
jgi:hypothetical protein